MPVHVIHRGKYKTLTAAQRTWLRGRQAIEPAIGHAKGDHRTGRCWLKGSGGDVLHAVLCAAGFNTRWLLRTLALQAAKAISLALNLVALYAAIAVTRAVRAAPAASGQTKGLPLGVAYPHVPRCPSRWSCTTKWRQTNFAGPTT